MSLYDLIIVAFPELDGSDAFLDGTITLRNDSDGTGDYIEHWGYAEPLPESLLPYLREPSST